MSSIRQDRYEREQKGFAYLQMKNNQPVSIEDLSANSGWAPASIRKYLQQNWHQYIAKVDANSFKPIGFESLTYEQFRHLQSQSSKAFNNTLPENIKLSEESTPFSKEKLHQILTLDKENLDFLIDSESHEVEYKEKFHIRGAGDYAKTIAAFANNSGGYFVFGVKNNRQIIGLQDSQFQDLDPARAC